MVTKVQSWGKSRCLRLSKRIIEDARVSVGDEVDCCGPRRHYCLHAGQAVGGKVSLRKLVGAGFPRAIGRKKPSGACAGGAKRRPPTCKRQRSSKMVEARPSDYQCIPCQFGRSLPEGDRRGISGRFPETHGRCSPKEFRICPTTSWPNDGNNRKSTAEAGGRISFWTQKVGWLKQTRGSG